MAFFSLLAFLFFIELLNKGKIIYLFLNWASFTIALFCKETAALLPLLFILYFFTFSAKKNIEKKYLLSILLYIVSVIFWFYMRYQAIGDISVRKDVTGLIPLLSNLRTIPESLAKFFLPFDNNPIPVFSVFKTLAGSGIIFIIIIMFFKNRKKFKKEKIFCFSWFLILMLPPMLYKNVFTDYYDHRFFLPLIGILLFVLLVMLKGWYEKRNIIISRLMAGVFVFLCFFSFVKSGYYSNPMIFYDSAVSHNPNSALAYNNRGLAKNANRDYQGALENYNKAIAISPTYVLAYYNRGNSKLSLGDNPGALDDYNKAIAFDPDYSEAFNNIGWIMYSTGNFHEAIINFNKAIEINPKFLLAYENRSLTRYSLKDLKGAVEDCDNVLKLNPGKEIILNLKAKYQKELSLL
jgi:hypothetical protein